MTKNYSNEELRMLICTCITRRYTTKESIGFLKSHGHNISERAFFQKKTELRDGTPHQTRLILENLVSEHLRRINELEEVDKELWLICKSNSDDNTRLKALNSIRENQIQLSEFIKNTLTIIHEQMNWFKILPLGDKINVKKYFEEKRRDLETPHTEVPSMSVSPFLSLEQLNNSKKKQLDYFLESLKIDENNSN